MKKISIITSSVTLALALALNGCGGGSSSNTATISGKAIDPYLKDATVCLDINHNGTCESSEPKAKTDSHGKYTLHLAQEDRDAVHTLLVKGGVDTGTNTAFKGTLTAVKDTEKTEYHITPLTTAVEARYHYCQADDDCHETLSQIESSIAEYLGLEKGQVNADIEALANRGHDKPLKTALALEASAESRYQSHPHRFYEEIGKHGFPEGHNWKDDIKTLMPKEYGLVTAIMNLDEGTLEEVHNSHLIAHETVEDNVLDTRAHMIAQYVHGLSHSQENNTTHTRTRAGTRTGTTAANTGTKAGNDAADTGVKAGNGAANTGTKAGTSAANTGTKAGNDAADTGVKAGNGAANTGTKAGTSAANTGTKAGNDAADTGTKAGNGAANTGTKAGTSAANTGTKAGNDAADTGTKAGNGAANTGTKAGTSAANTGTKAGNDAADTGTKAGNGAANTGTKAGTSATRTFGR